jgi:hypothetical protein
MVRNAHVVVAGHNYLWPAQATPLGSVQLVPQDEAESPGFVRRFDPKMELADIEIAAWRGEYLVDQLRSPH